ncbi:unnamed protein product [Vitrella brassicaformis CCMP3155]|uniref:Uncharacterized protein n=1 Tax=Vitrella brassicaformis (strain CCMP3155) TaxID=1169540 RepID=A0A0G4ELS6_VITBC|nr:unnamed protein product [Vitrella brassicaformis CCMP3155]|eukprot:CEL97922.1 unnamed protein product [Vitrella brassicaformis CCMP3155]
MWSDVRHQQSPQTLPVPKPGPPGGASALQSTLEDQQASPMSASPMSQSPGSKSLRERTPVAGKGGKKTWKEGFKEGFAAAWKETTSAWSGGGRGGLEEDATPKRLDALEKERSGAMMGAEARQAALVDEITTHMASEKDWYRSCRCQCLVAVGVVLSAAVLVVVLAPMFIPEAGEWTDKLLHDLGL